MINLEMLKKGRDYLANHVTDEQFDMDHYMQSNNGSDINVSSHNCGAIGCALGWITQEPSIKEQVINKGFERYTEVSFHLLGIKVLSKEWDFIFSSNYSEEDSDNTREGAIGRLDVILKYPDLFEVEEL